MKRDLVLVLCLLGGSCHWTAVVGSSIECQADSDCSPPDLVCSADGRCVPGCASHSAACVGGATCNAATGECEGGTLVGKSCGSDGDCDPPDLICKTASKQCVAGCDVDPSACYNGWICDYESGRCCDPAVADCRSPDHALACNSDGDCAARSGTVCFAGTCAPGCARSACTAPSTCGASGHCGPPGGSCARDADCDGASACTHAGACAVLAAAGPIPCAGGATVSNACNALASPSSFSACVGAAGPAACPYCAEGSCLRPGLCAAAAECHAGDDCVGGLCRPSAPVCPSLAAVAVVVAGGFATGHEVCVQARVDSVTTTDGGNVTLHLGSSPAIYAELTPLYLATGLARPASGDTITVHGAVRWDGSRNQFEIAPVDWWSR